MVKSILRNLTVLNGFLFAAIAAWVFLVVLPFLNMDIKMPASRPILTTVVNKAKTAQLINPAAVDYTLISEQNLFHPERKIPPEKTVEKVVPRPEIVLYGTVLTNDVSIAYIEDKKAPRTTPGRGKRQIAAEKGYNMNGYILQQIYPDSIVFVKGDDRILIRWEDCEKRRDMEMTKLPMAAGEIPASPPQAASAASKTVQQPKMATSAAASPQQEANPPVFGTTGRRNAAQIQVQKRREAALQMQKP